MSLNLRSIICAPIRGKSGVRGILYLDTDSQEQHYTHEHMLLVTAVGNSAGLALENAELHQELLAKQRIDQDIEHAGIIQEGFLIRTWENPDPRFQVYGETRPAKIIGGDFYDFVQLDEDHVGVLIGDVSGKGVSAALAMAQLLAEFRVRVVQESRPERVLEALNQGMAERSRRGMFCTLCYFTLDLRDGTVYCSNAGHHPAMLNATAGVETFAGASGPPVGILRDAVWTCEETTLSKGDTLLMYTDGIVEARGEPTRTEDSDWSKPAEYGEEALGVLVSGLRQEEPSVLIREVLKDVDRYCEPGVPHDDCTLIALRYMG